MGAYARSPAYSWAPVRTQQKTSALGKPDADLFIARTDASQPTTSQPASEPKWQYPAVSWELELLGYIFGADSRGLSSFKVLQNVI